MPRKKRKLIMAAQRAAEARRIVADLNDRIVTLKASERPTLEAERALETYISSLRHLEGYERRIREEDKAKKRETKKRDRQRSIDAISDQQPLTHDEGSDANRHLVG